MQPKFTRGNLGYFCAKILAVALILVASSQLSLAQERPAQVLPDNDAGLPNQPIVVHNPNNPQAVCTTWTGVVDGSDAPTSLRAFRDGVIKTCAAPGTCTAGIGGSFQYEQLTWVNPTAAVQCVTVGFTCTSGAFGFVTAHNGSVVLTNLCTNWLGDPGSSATVGQTITWSFNAPPLATIVFMVTNLGAASGYQITVDAPLCTPPAPCAGTPNPGNTLSNVAAACPSVPVQLTLQNPTAGSGVTYQWQTSASGSGPWTNAGPNNPQWNVLQTTATWYRCIVTCTNSGQSGTSTPVFVDQNPFYNCYCNSSAGNNADEDIFNVTIGSLNNSSNCATTPGAPPNPGPGSSKNRYSNYRGQIPPGNVVTGNMQISVTVGTCGGNFSNGVAAWIDFNHNGVFDHPAERIYNEPSTTVGPHVATGTAVIPTSALTGITGMRVLDLEGNPATITPCAAYTWGETEDYLVNIQPCVPLPISGITAPAAVTGECSGIVAIPVNTGTASFPSFQWEYRVNAASPWQMAIDGGLGGVITGATTGTLVLINVPSSLSGYQFRAIATNPCSAPDFTSPPTTVTIGPLVARVTPTSATICRGDIQQLSLTSPQASFCSGTVNVNVPDFDPNGIGSVIPVSGIPTSATITEIRITFNMTHTWVGDMVFNLKAPNGQTINLIGLLDNGTGSNGSDDFVNTSVSSDNTKPPMSGAPAPRTGVFRADRFTASVPGIAPTTTNSWVPLMNAATINGNWTLAMCDLGPADLGVLQNWCITISYGAPVSGIWTQSPAPAPPNQYAGMWTNAGATIAYTGGPASTIWVNPTANTVYTVIASTTSPACTSAPTQIPVNVTQPMVNLVGPTNTTVCRGGVATFTATATSAGGAPYNGPFTYVWQESRDNGLTWNTVTNGGIYSGATTATLTLTGVTREAPSDMNNYRYRVTVSAPPCPGSTTTAAATLTVLALPTVTISATDLALTPGQTSVITATSSPAPNAVNPNWVWTRNGVTIAGATTNSVTANIDQLGTYQVSVTDINGCRNSSNKILIESEVSDRLWIYPNPTTGKFQVRLYYNGVYTEKRRVIIYDQAGHEILSADFPMSNVTPHYKQLDFDLSHMAGGVYVVKVYDLYTKKHVQGLLIKQ